MFIRNVDNASFAQSCAQLGTAVAAGSFIVFVVRLHREHGLARSWPWLVASAVMVYATLAACGLVPA